MRIDDGNRLPQSSAIEPKHHDHSRASHGKVDAAADAGAVSPLAKKLGGADEQRLEALRIAVENGTYAVTAAELANSIIDSHLKP